MPEVTAPIRITAAMIRELRLAVKDKALSSAQFQSMVGAPYTPPVTRTPENLSEDDREATAATIEAWRANHPPVIKGEAS